MALNVNCMCISYLPYHDQRITREKHIRSYNLLDGQQTISRISPINLKRQNFEADTLAKIIDNSIIENLI